ncbi:putative receptor-like protein kinase At5g59700 [Bidens hawaiensis]|uniref:putative receptor-like protein kinase At5g59700 n=1 Tax=Bidens hawaiensis TaxID=980011 RepID=UPI00404A477C
MLEWSDPFSLSGFRIVYDKITWHYGIGENCDNVSEKCGNLSEQYHSCPWMLGKNEHLRIHLEDIKHATSNFSETSKIAFGGYFSLYRVQLDHFDIEYPIYGTIKRIHPEQHMYIEENFYKEIEVLTSVKHPNIVTLLGFCVEDSEMILLIDDLSNGHLVDCLKEVNQYKCILTWEKRLKICIDVAHALNYLHSEMNDKKMIINRYISSRHIGLDTNWEPKIIEFGFSIYLPPNLPEEAHYVKNISGLKYSTDPVYKTWGRLKRESDVYSFGVLLFEILCGRTSNDAVYLKENVKGLAHVAIRGYETRTLENMIDPIIKAETSENNFVLIRGPNKNSLYTFFNIAYECLKEKQDQRPSMKVVLQELEKALTLQSFNTINNKNNSTISLKDIEVATNNFSDCIGGGGFGNAYKGNLKYGDGFKTIVEKKLDKSSDQGEPQFLNEILILLEYKHENVIGLIGYCDEQDEKIIVYEYAPRGSLDRYLSNASLTWVQRLNICIDVASALDFFHGGVGKQANVIHRDIKSENILLSDDWKAKLADFGLSLISSITEESDYIINRACGTPGYVDPIYSNLRFLTRESDIYSFGVVLFEILCGRSTFAIKKCEGHHLADFVETKFKEGKLEDVVFEQIREQIGPKSLTTFQRIAYQCLRHEREKRPTAKKVLRELKNALEFLNIESAIPKCAPLQIPLEDVVNATSNFHHDNIIGHDAFGPIYKGRILRSGNLISVTARRLDRQHGLGDLEFWTEVTVLSDLKHANIVSIIGFCDQEDEKVIVATQAVNGSLGRYLNNPSLTWMHRLRIFIGVARALSYLRYNEGRDYYFIHCSINSSTVLLDENWEAKLSYFEYSIKQYYKDQVRFCEPIGSTWYMDPSVGKTGGVTHKSDIYSFGVVLFEILNGQEAYTKTGSLFQTQLAKYYYEKGWLNSVVLPDLRDQVSTQSLIIYSNVAYSCLDEEPGRRPDIGYIVAELEKALSVQLNSEANSDYMVDYRSLSDYDSLNIQICESGNLECHNEEIMLPDHTNE